MCRDVESYVFTAFNVQPAVCVNHPSGRLGFNSELYLEIPEDSTGGSRTAAGSGGRTVGPAGNAAACPETTF